MFVSFRNYLGIKSKFHARCIVFTFFQKLSPGYTQSVAYLSESPAFKPKKVLILTKLSRYDFERHRNRELNEKELEDKLHNRGSDYNLLLYHHYIHKGIQNTVECTFRAAGIETKVVTRFDYTSANIDWADAIITTGGDGTYLLAATRILDQNKPLVGFNSDPLRSKGHLCLPKKYSVNVKEAVDKLLQGKFKWTFRKRIRITLIGERIYDPPIELHDQELEHPENRYLDIDPQLPTLNMNGIKNAGENQRVLPILALNEVFIGECVSARVSYMELTFNGGPSCKSKSSGLIASTGTGSTSWTYSVNKLTEQNMEDILSIVKEESGLPFEEFKDEFIQKVTDKFNKMLIIDPEAARMVYTIRDQTPTSPLSRSAVAKPRGFANRIAVKSRMFDACLVIDGGASFRFNDGTRALLQVIKEDALLTVTLLDHPDVIHHKH